MRCFVTGSFRDLCIFICILSVKLLTSLTDQIMTTEKKTSIKLNGSHKMKKRTQISECPSYKASYHMANS